MPILPSRCADITKYLRPCYRKNFFHMAASTELIVAIITLVAAIPPASLIIWQCLGRLKQRCSRAPNPPGLCLVDVVSILEKKKDDIRADSGDLLQELPLYRSHWQIVARLEVSPLTSPSHPSSLPQTQSLGPSRQPLAWRRDDRHTE